MRLGSVKGGLGCAKAIEPVKFVVSFVSMMFFLRGDRGRSAWKRGMRGRVWTGTAIDRRIGGMHRCCLFIYTPVLTVS